MGSSNRGINIVPNAAYLDYPILYRTAADRRTQEKNMLSISYRDLCRHTLKHCMGLNIAGNTVGVERLLEQNPFVLSLSIAGLWVYALQDSLGESTAINGPILSFFTEERQAALDWMRTNRVPLPLSEHQTQHQNVEVMAHALIRWVWLGRPDAPRSLWFTNTISTPRYAELRGDLCNFSN
jgi:hypothetical protein